MEAWFALWHPERERADGLGIGEKYGWLRRRQWAGPIRFTLRLLVKWPSWGAVGATALEVLAGVSTVRFMRWVMARRGFGCRPKRSLARRQLSYAITFT